LGQPGVKINAPEDIGLRVIDEGVSGARIPHILKFNENPHIVSSS
jgi:hypothetical protein